MEDDFLLETQSKSRLKISEIPTDISEWGLKNLFSRFGRVSEVRPWGGQGRNEVKGTKWVASLALDSQKEAEKAILTFDGKEPFYLRVKPLLKDPKVTIEDTDWSKVKVRIPEVTKIVEIDLEKKEKTENLEQQNDQESTRSIDEQKNEETFEFEDAIMVQKSFQTG